MYWNLKRILAWGTAVTLVLTITLYAYLKSVEILGGPRITDHFPANGTSEISSLIVVSGTIKHANEVTLDGRPIFIDLEGRFAEKLLLAEGYNIIELVAKDAQGRSERKTIELVYR